MDQKTRGLLDFYSKKYFNMAGMILMVVLMVPTVAIMATWNTLPGDSLYPVKNYLEKTALILVGDNFSARTDLQTRFVGQRFSETEVLLAQSSAAGLQRLVEQIQITKTEIVVAKNSGDAKEVVIAQAKAEKLVVQLVEYEEKLEIVKEQLVETADESSVESESNDEVQESQIQEEMLEVEEVRDVIAQVEEVQEEIDEVIEELEEVAEVEEPGRLIFGSENYVDEIVEEEDEGEEVIVVEEEVEETEEEDEEKVKINNGVSVDIKK